MTTIAAGMARDITGLTVGDHIAATGAITGAVIITVGTSTVITTITVTTATNQSPREAA